jgi:hypothetical protein
MRRVSWPGWPSAGMRSRNRSRATAALPAMTKDGYSGRRSGSLPIRAGRLHQGSGTGRSPMRRFSAAGAGTCGYLTCSRFFRRSNRGRREYPASRPVTSGARRVRRSTRGTAFVRGAGRDPSAPHGAEVAQRTPRQCGRAIARREMGRSLPASGRSDGRRRRRLRTVHRQRPIAGLRRGLCRGTRSRASCHWTSSRSDKGHCGGTSRLHPCDQRAHRQNDADNRDGATTGPQRR